MLCRFFDDPPAAGAWNMAVDAALAEAAAASGVPSLRVYRWSEPTLSLGYFQSQRDRESHVASRTLPVVRRESGGGAIVHHHEWTYSLAVPAALPWAKEPLRLYRAAHEALAAVLKAWGLAAALCESATTDEPFLCFSRRAIGDLVAPVESAGTAAEQAGDAMLAGNAKLAGSAQRRHRGAVSQHGSVLVARSDFAPELPGAADLLGRTIDDRPWIAAWLPLLASQLDWHFEPAERTAAENDRASQLIGEKFAAAEWTDRR